MIRLRVLLARTRALARSRQMDREIEDEMASHLDEAAEDFIRQGLSPEEARRAARRRFGGVTQAMEVHRELRRFAWVDELSRDARYAVRTLRRNPAFSATAAATLALAIAASTAMFSVLDAVLLRPLPYASPDRLAMLWTEDPSQNLREGRSSLQDVEEWRRQSQTFASLATFDGVGTLLTGADGVEQIAGASMSANLLDVLGVRPVLGRGFSVEAVEQGQRAVMISHRLWQARFGGSADALGATLVVNGAPAQIAGVLPSDFLIGRLDADVWQAHAAPRAMRGGQTWFVVGRLRPGMSFAQAQAEMNAIARRSSEQLPAAQRGQGISVVPLDLSVLPPSSRLALWMLAGAVLCLFLIAAANVTSLSLARSTARSREMAVRAALGANAGRIVRQLLTENVMLAAVAGLLGTLLAAGAVRLIRAFGPSNLPRLNEVDLDLRVLAWAAASSLLAGILVGLAPAFATLRRNLRPSGEESGRTVSASTSTRRFRRALVVGEFALAIVLLAGAGLLVRSWIEVSRVDAGFTPERVLVMDIAAPAAFSAAQRTDMFNRVLEEIQGIPGVERAGITDDLFSANPREHLITIERDAGTTAERFRLTQDEISADFFRTMGTPLVRGRTFSREDGPDAPRAAIVNEAMAKRAWPDGEALGRRFMLGAQNVAGPWFTVVGVAADMRRQGLEREPLPQIFVPLTQNPASRSVGFFVRTSAADPLTIAAAARAAVRRVEPNAAIAGVTTLDQQLGSYLAQRRFQTVLLASFSAVALLMAAIGIYGLIQYSVATRTAEIGLRMAIGAQAGDIFRMIIGEGLALSLAGVAIGLVGALWLGGAGASLLFGVSATDPLTFAAVSLLLTAVAVAASYFPARRAMRVDPIRALRTT